MRLVLRLFGHEVMAVQVHRDEPAPPPVECDQEHVRPPIGFRVEAGTGVHLERSYQDDGDVVARRTHA